MKKQILFVLVVVIGLALVLSGTVMAISPEERDAHRAELQSAKDERELLREELKDTRDQLKEERNEFRDKVKEDMKEKMCERWQNRIRTRLNRYENKKQQHEQVFGSLIERLKKVSSGLKDAGLDTADLNGYISELEDRVDVLTEAHESFIGELQLADDQSCGESEGEFKNQLGEARRMIPEVRSALDDVRNHYRDVVRPELIKLKMQLIDEDEEASGNEEDEEGQGNVIKTEDETNTSIKVVKENIQESNSTSISQ